MLKPKKGSLLIKRIQVQEKVSQASGIILELVPKINNTNPFLIKASVIEANLDHDDVKVGDTVLAQFIALTPVAKDLYVIPFNYIDAIIEPGADIIV